MLLLVLTGAASCRTTSVARVDSLRSLAGRPPADRHLVVRTSGREEARLSARTDVVLGRDGSGLVDRIQASQLGVADEGLVVLGPPRGLGDADEAFTWTASPEVQDRLEATRPPGAVLEARGDDGLALRSSALRAWLSAALAQGPLDTGPWVIRSKAQRAQRVLAGLTRELEATSTVVETFPFSARPQVVLERPDGNLSFLALLAGLAVGTAGLWLPALAEAEGRPTHDVGHLEEGLSGLAWDSSPRRPFTARAPSPLFSAVAQRRAVYEPLVVVLAGSALFGQGASTAQVLGGVRLFEALELGLGVGWRFPNPWFVRDDFPLSEPLPPTALGLLVVGLSSAIDPDARLSIPTQVQLGTSFAGAWHLSLRLGLRLRLFEGLFVSLFPFGPQLFATPQAATWSGLTELDTGFAF